MSEVGWSWPHIQCHLYRITTTTESNVLPANRRPLSIAMASRHCDFSFFSCDEAMDEMNAMKLIPNT